ncbi:Ig-like domain-containing protein [Actinoplanes philippinensis]|uniref:Ig-like domain-containing protein n=1 Tax=Actinoplanes philippinensis TaxID=35752 RepID=UPI0033CF4236
MGMLRFGVIAALSSLLTITFAAPARAADTTAPTVSLIGFNDGQAIGSNVRFTPVVKDDVAVVAVDILVNGIYANSMSSVDGVYFDAADLRGVKHGEELDLTVRAWDAAGNHGDRTVRLRADLEAPTATITPDDDDDTILAGPATITASDVSPDTAQVIFADATGPLATRTAAPWTLTWDNRDPRKYQSLSVTVIDRARNKTRYELYYKGDDTGPSVWATTNWIPEVVGPGPGYLAVAYDDPRDVARIEWWIDGGLRSTTQVMHTYDFGTADRIADVEVRAFDALGNVTVLTRKVHVDATGPTITSVTPAQGALVRGNTLRTEIKATDSSGLNQGYPAVFVTDPFGNQYPLSSAPYRQSLFLVDGPARISWTVYDRFRNPTVVRRDVIMDSTVPSVAFTKAPKNKAKVKGAVKVTASAWDRNGVNRVELLINGKVVARDAKAGYAFSINTKKYGKKIKVQVRAYDRAGNARISTARTWYR